MAQRVQKLEFDTERVASGSELYLQVIETAGRVQKFVSLIEKNIDVKGRLVFVTQKHLQQNGCVDIDSSVATKKDFSPLYYSALLNDGTVKEAYRFSKNKVNGTTDNGDGPKIVTYDFGNKKILNAVIQGELLKTLNFNESKSHSYLIYNPGKTVLHVTYRIVGEENLSIGGQTISALVVDMEGALLPTKIWLSKNDQSLMKQCTNLPNGSKFWKKRIWP